ncbi:MAG TPA: bifunctional heptose 7-phosphate kinase/heptose 1-phosphate adenyltransferase [Bauldia sp.]|nr:bifunctional heptose 7-phosphate kinase/heptose 1-phosphate adenyltransferase [Bauldia sp.]
MDASLIDRLADADVLVVGDVLLDRFIEGSVSRISREAPVPVLRFGRSRALPGAACNVAANVLATGGAVTLVGLVGEDEPGAELAGLCRGFARMTPRLITDGQRQTSVKTRYLSGWQQLLCIDAEAPGPASHEVRDALITTALRAMPSAKAVVLSDYGRGALDDTAIRALIAAARKEGKPAIVDPRRSDASVFAGATLITPNIEEMLAFTGIRARSDDDAVSACQHVLEKANIDAVLLTRGSAGMTLVRRDGSAPLHVPAETHRVFDVTGAGDTVVATIASALASGASLPDAVRLANTAAGIVVSKPGTATALPQELRQALGAARGDGVLDRAEAAEHVRLWQSLGLKVGFTNGVFDLLHRGHLHSLEQAKRRVDRLVVGVNADASVRRLKGPDRPVQDESARAAVLAALRTVDLVVIFAEDTPEELIRAIRPDLLFKGSDYAGQDIPGAAFVKGNGGSVEFLPLLAGYSTTGTVSKVRKGDS